MAHTSNTVRVDEADGDQVVLGVEITPVRHSEWLVCDGVPDRTPDVNDTNAALEQTFSIFTEMAMHSCNTSIERLVDMDAFLGRSKSVGYRDAHGGIVLPQDHGAVGLVWGSRRVCASMES